MATLVYGKYMQVSAYISTTKCGSNQFESEAPLRAPEKHDEGPTPKSAFIDQNGIQFNRLGRPQELQ